MIEIVVALIAASGVVVASWLANKSSNNKVLDKIQTNDGKEPWQYLEMVQEVKLGQDALLLLMAEHTRQDEQRFTDLSDQITELRGTYSPSSDGDRLPLPVGRTSPQVPLPDQEPPHPPPLGPSHG